MKRFTFSVFVTLVWLFHLPRLSPWLLAVLGLLLLIVLFRRGISGYVYLSGITLAVVLLAMAIHSAGARTLELNQVGSDLRLKIRIASLPSSSSKGYSFRAQVLNCLSCETYFRA